MGSPRAQVVYTPLIGRVGFNTTGYGKSFKQTVVPGATFLVWGSSGVSGPFHFWEVGITSTGNLTLRPGIAAPGQTWSQVSSSTFGIVGARYTRSGSAGYFGHKGTFYKLFRFTSNGKTEYGWIELNQTVTTTTGPNVQILAMAYDPSGGRLAAGSTGSGVPAPTPIPSTLGLGALGALALGAVGLRLWRAGRNKAA